MTKSTKAQNEATLFFVALDPYLFLSREGKTELPWGAQTFCTREEAQRALDECRVNDCCAWAEATIETAVRL